jgi:Uncharacterized protein conserved in bacteria
MDIPEFLPLGSIVVVRGNVKKLLIIARGLALTQNGEQRYFDYGACMYPEGLLGDQVIYFNHDVIIKTVFTGYSDDDEALMIESLERTLEHVTIKRGDPAPFELPDQEKQKEGQ